MADSLKAFQRIKSKYKMIEDKFLSSPEKGEQLSTLLYRSKRDLVFDLTRDKYNYNTARISQLTRTLELRAKTNELMNVSRIVEEDPLFYLRNDLISMNESFKEIKFIFINESDEEVEKFLRKVNEACRDERLKKCIYQIEEMDENTLKKNEKEINCKKEENKYLINEYVSSDYDITHKRLVKDDIYKEELKSKDGSEEEMKYAEARFNSKRKFKDSLNKRAYIKSCITYESKDEKGNKIIEEVNRYDDLRRYTDTRIEKDLISRMLVGSVFNMDDFTEYLAQNPDMQVEILKMRPYISDYMARVIASKVEKEDCNVNDETKEFIKTFVTMDCSGADKHKEIDPNTKFIEDYMSAFGLEQAKVNINEETSEYDIENDGQYSFYKLLDEQDSELDR